jgi:signal transduction histidine kinase
LYLSRFGIESFRGESTRVMDKEIPYGFSCTAAPSGRAWLGYRAGASVVLETGEARDIQLPEEFDDGVEIVFEDHRGRLWLTRGERVCQGDAQIAVAGSQQDWSCTDFPGSNHAFDLLSFEDGQVWMATDHAGLFLFEEGRWIPHPGIDPSLGQTFGSLSHAPSGGVWLATPGGPVRVVRDPSAGAPHRLRVVEHLSHWHGLPTDGVGDVLEMPDGSLYATTWRGLVWIPEKTRRRERPAPIPRLDRVVSGGVESSKEQRLELEYGDNDLQLHFRAPVFRDARLLRFRVRMNAEEAWGTPSAANVLNFVNLSPGEYTVQAQASIEGGQWSEPTEAYTFTVRRPWFWSPWPWLGTLSILALIAFVTYRTRVAFLLRMERQRMQIAMDLHDEVGSGLGSIGLLANVAADFPGEGEAQRELVEQIAETANSLGTSMSDIVWSLRPEAGQLRSLAARLHERGNLLFPGEEPRFRINFPETWPPEQLGLTVRRNLYAIAVEAMHNAAKHSGASEVELELGWDDAEFLLRVSDDGAGFDYAAKADAETGGLGLRSMRLRAEDMGARLHVGSGGEGRGSSVEVRLARKKSQRQARKSRLT